MAQYQLVEFSWYFELHIEKVRRSIKGCQDIDLLRDIAFQLFDLNKKKITIDQLKILLSFNIDQDDEHRVRDN